MDKKIIKKLPKYGLVVGSGGIGTAVATRMKKDGFKVILADNNQKKLFSIAEKNDFIPVKMDLNDEKSVENAFLECDQICKDGVFYALVNAAGLHTHLLLIEMKAKEWDKIHNVNLRGAFLTCREAAKRLIKNKGGRIINILTKLGFGNPWSACYMASKSALYALTQSLAIELAKAKITVNGVGPGHLGPNSGMSYFFKLKAKKMNMKWEEFEQQVFETTPLGRWCEPKDVAGVVSYLLKEEANFITGENIVINGGFQSYAKAPDILKNYQ